MQNIFKKICGLILKYDTTCFKYDSLKGSKSQATYLLNTFTGLRFVLSFTAAYLGRFYLLQRDSQWNVHGLYRVSRRVFKCGTTLPTPQKLRKHWMIRKDTDKMYRTVLHTIANTMPLPCDSEPNYITLVENNNKYRMAWEWIISLTHYLL